MYSQVKIISDACSVYRYADTWDICSGISYTDRVTNEKLWQKIQSNSVDHNEEEAEMHGYVTKS